MASWNIPRLELPLDAKFVDLKLKCPDDETQVVDYKFNIDDVKRTHSLRTNFFKCIDFFKSGDNPSLLINEHPLKFNVVIKFDSVENFSFNNIKWRFLIDAFDNWKSNKRIFV